jgi:hypothetical protein
MSSATSRSSSPMMRAAARSNRRTSSSSSSGTFHSDLSSVSSLPSRRGSSSRNRSPSPGRGSSSSRSRSRSRSSGRGSSSRSRSGNRSNSRSTSRSSSGSSSSSCSSSSSRSSRSSESRRRGILRNPYLRRVSNKKLEYNYNPHKLTFRLRSGKFKRNQIPNKMCRLMLSHCSKRHPLKRDEKPRNTVISIGRKRSTAGMDGRGPFFLNSRVH